MDNYHYAYYTFWQDERRHDNLNDRIGDIIVEISPSVRNVHYAVDTGEGITGGNGWGMRKTINEQNLPPYDAADAAASEEDITTMWYPLFLNLLCGKMGRCMRRGKYLIVLPGATLSMPHRCAVRALRRKRSMSGNNIFLSQKGLFASKCPKNTLIFPVW